MRTWLTQRAWRTWLGGAAIVVGAILVVALIQVIYKVWVFDTFHRMDTRGQFGDLFGAVNAFFTGLAFAGVVFTLFLQRRELEETTTLSVIATLVDTYTSRIDTMEQGKFRGELWAANIVMRDEEDWDEEDWDEEEVAETSGGKKARRDEIRKSVCSYIEKYPDSPTSKWFRKPQNCRDFVAWVDVRRRRNYFLAILEDKFVEVRGRGRG